MPIAFSPPPVTTQTYACMPVIVDTAQPQANKRNPNFPVTATAARMPEPRSAAGKQSTSMAGKSAPGRHYISAFPFQAKFWTRQARIQAAQLVQVVSPCQPTTNSSTRRYNITRQRRHQHPQKSTTPAETSRVTASPNSCPCSTLFTTDRKPHCCCIVMQYSVPHGLVPGTSVNNI